MRQVSKKRASRKRERDAAVREAFERERRAHGWEGDWCVAGPGGRLEVGTPCSWHGGPFDRKPDPHELVRRSQWAEGIYVASNIVPLCRGHHSYYTDHPQAAFDAGLAKHRWEIE